jgi:hypothetical protein
MHRLQQRIHFARLFAGLIKKQEVAKCQLLRIPQLQQGHLLELLVVKSGLIAANGTTDQLDPSLLRQEPFPNKRLDTTGRVAKRDAVCGGARLDADVDPLVACLGVVGQGANPMVTR